MKTLVVVAIVWGTLSAPVSAEPRDGVSGAEATAIADNSNHPVNQSAKIDCTGMDEADLVDQGFDLARCKKPKAKHVKKTKGNGHEH